MNCILGSLKEWGCGVDVALERFVQDEELYISCLEKFVDDASFNQLKVSLADKNYEEAFNQAHTLKGVAANLGLDPMFVCISEMVEDLRAKKYDDLDVKSKAIEGACAKFREIMSA